MKINVAKLDDSNEDDQDNKIHYCDVLASCYDFQNEVTMLFNMQLQNWQIQLAELQNAIPKSG